jgi:hypothetical protein
MILALYYIVYILAQKRFDRKWNIKFSVAAGVVLEIHAETRRKKGAAKMGFVG